MDQLGIPISSTDELRRDLRPARSRSFSPNRGRRAHRGHGRDHGRPRSSSSSAGERPRSTSSTAYDRVSDQWPVADLHAHYGPPRRSWHHRPQSPSLKWYKRYDQRSLRNGRVLVIDYVRQELSKKGMRKVSAQEINHVHSLRRLYASKRRDEAVLRVFHVQNAPWAVTFLCKKFNIADRDDLIDSDFARWISYKHPLRPGGQKPLLGGKSWETQHDPWRAISKTSFGFDYLKAYQVRDPQNQVESDAAGKVMELNCYDETTEIPEYGFDVYGQRLGVYVQHKEDVPGDPRELSGAGVENPYQDSCEKRSRRGSADYFPVLDSLDNGNAVIIFENSKSESIEDTLVAARAKWESRWRRLPFYLAYDSHDIDSDDQTALLCARTVLADIFRALSENWSHFLAKANRHVEILEGKIYDRPADESRADEIWKDSSNWLRCERLAYVHQNLVDEVGANLREISDDDILTDQPWLRANVPDFARINNLIQEDLVKPTNNLSDLMYKSVGIRDTRHSLELSYSMWRLSWITFIFLPLTFTVGFFGMNVTTFANDPDIKWFFIAAVPLMALVLVLWFGLKWALTASRYDPYSRGVYERMFHDLATQYPALWTRGGPLAAPPPASGSSWQRLKWALVRRWNEPTRTIRAPRGVRDVVNEEERFDGLGWWSRVKRVLTRRWTAELHGVATDTREPERGGPRSRHAVREGLATVNRAIWATTPSTHEHPELAALAGRGTLADGVRDSPTKDDAARLVSYPGLVRSGAFGTGRRSPEIRANGTVLIPGNGAAGASTSGAAADIPFDLSHRLAHVRPIGTTVDSDGRPSSADSMSRTSGIMVEERAGDSFEDGFVSEDSRSGSRRAVKRESGLHHGESADDGEAEGVGVDVQKVVKDDASPLGIGRVGSDSGKGGDKGVDQAGDELAGDELAEGELAGDELAGDELAGDELAGEEEDMKDDEALKEVKRQNEEEYDEG